MFFEVEEEEKRMKINLYEMKFHFDLAVGWKEKKKNSRAGNGN
jgi:hypothetical protein